MKELTFKKLMLFDLSKLYETDTIYITIYKEIAIENA